MRMRGFIVRLSGVRTVIAVICCRRKRWYEEDRHDDPPPILRAGNRSHPIETHPLRVGDDPRWHLAQRVASGQHFSRAPLLSQFLLFIVEETLEGRQTKITEHEIGVRVFGRAPGYRTVEDNIVRNYARQLRKRLHLHFCGAGSSESLQIEIPVGGYVPAFVPAEQMGATEVEHELPTANSHSHIVTSRVPDHVSVTAARWSGRQWLVSVVILIVYSAILIAFTWLLRSPGVHSPQVPDPTQPLWATLFAGPSNSYIVPADAGFNLLEDLSHRSLPLADYVSGTYQQMSLAPVDSHSAQDLRSQQLTSFVDLQIVAALARRQEFDPRRVFLRFPRDLRLDELKNANAVIIGSAGSNPWAAIASENTNFHVAFRQGMKGAEIINTKPNQGEAESYESHWSEPVHETFAVISFVPNLSGSGCLLLLQGLDVAGTQAAAEALFHSDATASILKAATRPDGSLRFFEILVRSTSIQSNAMDTQVIASRIH